eukprot:augustus_masked-scaffold_12-processed-gene-6.58-mRNA-1 protein AED:1.00 eAED:1.00 QI:0/-1/0/0/-1/1/1/0/389
MNTENNIKVLEGAKDYVTWRKRIDATLIEKGWMKILEAQETVSQEDKTSLLSTETKRKDNAKVCSIVYNRVSDPILERLDGIELAIDIFQTLKEWYKLDPRLQKLRLKHKLQHPAGRTLVEKIENFKITLRRLEKLNVPIEEDDKIDGILKVVRIKGVDTFRMIVDADRQNYSFQQVYKHLFFFAQNAVIKWEAKSDISSTREKGSQKHKNGSQRQHFNDKQQKICKNCGKRGHLAHQCRIPRCQLCNTLGHRDNQCRMKQEKTTKITMAQLKLENENLEIEEEDNEDAETVLIKDTEGETNTFCVAEIKSKSSKYKNSHIEIEYKSGKEQEKQNKKYKNIQKGNKKFRYQDEFSQFSPVEKSLLNKYIIQKAEMEKVSNFKTRKQKLV